MNRKTETWRKVESEEQWVLFHGFVKTRFQLKMAKIFFFSQSIPNIWIRTSDHSFKDILAINILFRAIFTKILFQLLKCESPFFGEFNPYQGKFTVAIIFVRILKCQITNKKPYIDGIWLLWGIFCSALSFCYFCNSMLLYSHKILFILFGFMLLPSLLFAVLFKQWHLCSVRNYQNGALMLMA